MLKQIQSQKPKITKTKKATSDEIPEFRNLRNCWYNECALNYPFDNLDERIKFASWKIMLEYGPAENKKIFRSMMIEHLNELTKDKG